MKITRIVGYRELATFNTFNRVGATQFAEAFRRKGVMWVFHHIPKTAGSSLTRELRFCFPPYKNIHYDQFDDDVDRHEGLAQAVDSFLAEHADRNFRSCSGHLRAKHLRTIRDSVPEARMFTVLRDPVERYVSEFRYMRTSAFPNHQQFVERFADLSDYIEAPESHNKQWNFVTSANREASLEEIQSIFNRYSFIALVEQLDDCFEYLTGLTGFPKRPSTHVNKTTTTGDNTVTVTPELRAQILSANAKDAALYDAVTSILTEQRDAMRDYCAERRGLFI